MQLQCLRDVEVAVDALGSTAAADRVERQRVQSSGDRGQRILAAAEVTCSPNQADPEQQKPKRRKSDLNIGPDGYITMASLFGCADGSPWSDFQCDSDF